MMPQSTLEPKRTASLTYDERVCSKCMGHRALCGIRPCPLVMRARALVDIDSAVHDLTLTGSSPPSVFVGDSGYPKVLVGPLVPPILGEQTAIMEQPDLWLDRSIDEIISFRFSLVRTKQLLPVDLAADPSRILAETQTMALSERPMDSEAILLKKPQFTSFISKNTLPIGPSAPLDTFSLEDNPQVPRAVDRVTSDTDLRATTGIMELFDDGIGQEHVTRLFSVGLVGVQKRRKLVPTKWSITAVDDIVGKQLHRQVLRLPWMNDFEVYSDYALGNRVILLFLPSAWQFEAMECWLSGSNPLPIIDYEWYGGRKNYASSVAGAYYATKLPALEQLVEKRKQAGVIVFMEIDPKIWVPLGVWRFRSIARRALLNPAQKFSTLDEAIQAVGGMLRSPLENWIATSKIMHEFQTQSKLTDFF